MTEPVEEAIVEARAADDEETLNFLIIQRGYAATFRGDLDAAEEYLTGVLAAGLRESVALSSALRDNWALVYGLVGLAGIAARHGQPARATRLFGAAEAMGEAASVTIAFPPARALYEQDLAIVKAQLDAEAFEASWEKGRMMPVKETVAEALVEDT